MKSSGTPTLYRPSTDKRQDSSVRRPNDSRSRSRDDRSKVSYASVRSNKSTGPVIFGGNSIIKKSDKVVESDVELLSKPEFSRSQNKSKSQTQRERQKT